MGQNFESFIEEAQGLLNYFKCFLDNLNRTKKKMKVDYIEYACENAEECSELRKMLHPKYTNWVHEFGAEDEEVFLACLKDGFVIKTPLGNIFYIKVSHRTKPLLAKKNTWKIGCIIKKHRKGFPNLFKIFDEYRFDEKNQAIISNEAEMNYLIMVDTEPLERKLRRSMRSK